MSVVTTDESTKVAPKGEHYFELDWIGIEGLHVIMTAYPMLKFQILTDSGPGIGNCYIGITGPYEDCKRMFLDEAVYGHDFESEWNEYYSKSIPADQRWPPGQTMEEWRKKLENNLAY